MKSEKVSSKGKIALKWYSLEFTLKAVSRHSTHFESSFCDSSNPHYCTYLSKLPPSLPLVAPVVICSVLASIHLTQLAFTID